MKLYQLIYLSIILLLSSSCKKEDTSNFTLKGSIKGLKKGIVYLQKDGDSSLIVLDSMLIKGQPEFELKTNIDEAIVLYLKLFKNDGEEHFIPFFADKGETYITTSLNKFNFDAKITGSKQQAVLEEYLKVMSNYNEINLELLKESFLAQKENDSVKVDSLQGRSDNLLKRKYAYTINFAFNHSNSEVAPYLALYEIPNTNIKFVDSIYNKLSDSIKKSYYGRKLKQALEMQAEGAVEEE